MAQQPGGHLSQRQLHRHIARMGRVRFRRRIRPRQRHPASGRKQPASHRRSQFRIDLHIPRMATLQRRHIRLQLRHPDPDHHAPAGGHTLLPQLRGHRPQRLSRGVEPLESRRDHMCRHRRCRARRFPFAASPLILSGERRRHNAQSGTRLALHRQPFPQLLEPRSGQPASHPGGRRRHRPGRHRLVPPLRHHNPRRRLAAFHQRTSPCRPPCRTSRLPPSAMGQRCRRQPLPRELRGRQRRSERDNPAHRHHHLGRLRRRHLAGGIRAQRLRPRHRNRGGRHHLALHHHRSFRLVGLQLHLPHHLLLPVVMRQRLPCRRRHRRSHLVGRCLHTALCLDRHYTVSRISRMGCGLRLGQRWRCGPGRRSLRWHRDPSRDARHPLLRRLRHHRSGIRACRMAPHRRQHTWLPADRANTSA